MNFYTLGGLGNFYREMNWSIKIPKIVLPNSAYSYETLFLCQPPLPSNITKNYYNCKISELEQIWSDNAKSILDFIGQTHKGVKGRVTSTNGQPVRGASLKVKTKFLSSL